ncbi:MAG: ribonuclease R [Alphaproteobacteria bacterium]|nr:ribonuclease R [Alphaproteobacteria bacterium]
MARKIPGAKRFRDSAPPSIRRPVKRPAAGALPSREDILEALAELPTSSSKRDLVRVFGIAGDMRVPFKGLLREMEEEGLIARSRKTLRRAAELPSVTVLDIASDADPEDMIAHPANWDEADGERPDIRIETPRGARVVPGPGDRILARIERGDGPVPVYSARAMKILDKPRRAQIGIVRCDDTGARLVPVDRKQREMRIEAGDLGNARDGDLVEVEVRAAGRLMLPKARVTAVVGNPDSEGAVSLVALHNLEIPYRFSPSVLAEAAEAEEIGIEGREDWRAIAFVTIDPETAKDHDDAVFAEPDADKGNEGGHVVYVAIADVAAYVRPGTGLDREAYIRGNSVYFPDRVVPMLPERISNDLCSLKGGENRPALGLRMVFDRTGHKRAHSFHRVTIRSAGKLAYGQAQAAIDGRPDDVTGPLLDPVLRPLWAAYAVLAEARDRRGPLALDLPERKIELDENGNVTGIHIPERLAAHRLIEEMMIMANVAAAETLERGGTPLVYRVHDSPGREKLAALKDFLNALKLPFSGAESVRPAHFNRVLKKAVEAGVEAQVAEMVLRSQAQAEYAPENYGHFGLNLDRYAHFTSPIRRYADLIVHRALIRQLGLGADGLTESEAAKLAGISQHISSTERRALMAERETNDRLLARFMADRIGARFMGRISGVTKSGLFVRLDETGADGFVPASSLGLEFFRYIEDKQALVGERTGETFGLGLPVEVRLLEAAPMAGALRFEILSEGPKTQLTGKRGGRGHPQHHRHKRR